MRENRKRRDGQSGNAMVEFALSASVLFVLFLGIFQWGYTFYIYNNIATSIRSGARYAAQKSFIPSSNSTTTPCASWIRQVQNVVVYGSPSGGTDPVAPGLAISNIAVSAAFDSGGVPTEIKVGISSTSPFDLNAGVAHTSLNGKPSVTFPYTGIYSPAATCAP